MNKNTNLCVDLKTILQEDVLMNQGQCYRGVMTRTGETSFLFEEAVQRNHSHHRNPKLYEGKYISLVHMQNGRYQVHMRTLLSASNIGHKELAFSIYSELLTALNIMEQ